MASETISITKGFGILLMVMAHAGCPKVAHDFIYMFHMPLFFMMSGYCFKPHYIDAPGQFVRRRAKGLYLPYVKYGLFFLLFHNVFFRLNIYNGEYGFNGQVSSLYSVTDFAAHALHIVTGMFGNEQLLGGYWFLRCLFWGSLVSLATIKVVRDNTWGGGILLLITMATVAFPALRVPYFGINGRVFMSATFFMAGYIIRKEQFEMRGSYAVLMCAVVFAGSVLMPASMLGIKTWQVIPYVALAVMGTLVVTHVSGVVAAHDGTAKKWMVWIGNNTLTILTWHFISFKLVSLFVIYVHHLPMERLAEFPVIGDYAQAYWPLYFVVGVAVPLLIGQTEVRCENIVSDIIGKS